MAFDIKLNLSLGIIEVKNSGSFSPEEMEKLRDEVISIKNETKLSKVLFDNTELGQLPPPEVISNFVHSIDPDLKHAGYIRPGQSSMDLRFMEINAKNQNKDLKLFTSREEALAWLTSREV